MVKKNTIAAIAAVIVLVSSGMPARADLADDLAAAIQAAQGTEQASAIASGIDRVQAELAQDIPGRFSVAAKVQVKLGGDSLLALRWRDQAIPVLLQGSFEETPLIVAAVVPGAPLPAPWAPAAAFLAPWVAGRDLPNQATGFARPLAPPMMAGALHPLAVRLLRPYLLGQLQKPGGEAHVLLFLNELADQAAAAPELAIAAGDLIITTAESRGVAIIADGTITAPASVQAWQTLVDRVLNTVVENSEAGDQLPPGWRGRAARVRELIDACAPWSTSPRGLGLRKRAQARVAQASKDAGDTLAATAAALPTGVNVLEETTPTFRGTPRFGTPLVARDSPSRDRYLATLRDASTAVATANVGLDRVRGSASLARRVRGEYARRIASPVLLSEIITATPPDAIPHVAALDGLRRANASMTTRQLRESIADPAAWPAVVNRRPAPEAPDSTQGDWAALELWDGLRGRGHGGDEDEAMVRGLLGLLPGWLLRDEPLPDNAAVADPGGAGDPWADLRPVVAALAHLDLPTGTDRAALVSRLEAILSQIPPASGLFRLLAAARIELAVAEATAPGLVPAEVLGGISRDRLDLWRQWSVAAIESGPAWQSRAGMDGLILLARMAQLSGNPIATAVATQAVADSPRTRAMTARSVDAAIAGRLTLKASDLPLALAASDLSRLHREAADSITPEPNDSFGAFARQPAWVNELAAPPAIATKLIDQLAEALAFDPQVPDKAVAFLAQARLPGRTLLTTVLEAKLGDLRRSLRFQIEPLRPSDEALVLLGKLRGTLRLLASSDGVLLEDAGRLEALGSAVPWWTVAFWDRPTDPASIPAGSTPEGRRIVLATWAMSHDRAADVQARSLAAALERSIPVPDPVTPTDVDGRPEWDFPRFTWAKAKSDFEAAIAILKDSEQAYAQAVRQQGEAQQAAEMIELLKKPLLLDVADHVAKIRAATAEVRAAEAELEASRHDSLATELEAVAAGLIYDAAKVEAERRAILADVAKLDRQVADLAVEATGIEQQIAAQNGNIHELKVKLLENQVQRAELTLKMAQQARQGVLKRINLLRSLLETPIQHTRPDGTQIEVTGQIGKMGAQIEDSLSKRLADDLADAEHDLAEEREKEAKRKKLERQRRLINAVTRFAGAVVGFVIGGPAGAALGVEIGGAIGEIANGVLENRPPENILVGLIDNAFAIADKAGVDLKGELNALGSQAADEAKQFFVGLDSTLGPLLETLPRVFDEATISDAMMVLGLEGEIPQFTALLKSSYGDLKRDVAGLDRLGDALEAAGVANPIVTDNPRALLDHLGQSLFARTADNAEQLRALGKAMGVQVERLTTDAGRREACERMAKVIIARVGLEAGKFRGDALRQWTIAQQQAQHAWDAVKEEGVELVNALYPDPKDRAEIIASLEMTLLDKATLQAEVEQALAPWQMGLDDQIAAISEACDKLVRDNPPKSAIDAARARVDSIKEFQSRFLGKTDANGGHTKGLVDWLKGDSDERRQLFLDLKRLEDEDLKKIDELMLAQIDVQGARMNVMIADAELDKAKLQIQELAVFLKQAKVQSEKASLMVRVADLAHLTAGAEAEAKDKSAEAAKERSAASVARIQAAQARLVVAQAGEEGVRQRGGVARRIESALSLPPIELDRGPNGLPQGVIAEARVRHANALEDALAAYRELLRHLRMAGLEAADFPVADFTLAARENVRLRWSVSLAEQYLPKITNSLFIDNGFKPTVGDPIRFELNDRQIGRLFSSGLEIVARPGVATSLDEDRVVLELDRSKARSGRVLVMMLLGKNTAGQAIRDVVHVRTKQTTYLGDRWLEGDNVFLTPEKVYPQKRTRIQDPATTGNAIDEWIALVNLGPKFGIPGDPRFEEVEGAPLSGTTVLRFEPVLNASGVPALGQVQQMEMILLYVYYEH